jgi:hypothetical protein
MHQCTAKKKKIPRALEMVKENPTSDVYKSLCCNVTLYSVMKTVWENNNPGVCAVWRSRRAWLSTQQTN